MLGLYYELLKFSISGKIGIKVKKQIGMLKQRVYATPIFVISP